MKEPSREAIQWEISRRDERLAAIRFIQPVPKWSELNREIHRLRTESFDAGRTLGASEERKRIVKVIDAECARVLSKQQKEQYETNSYIRMMAILLPDLIEKISGNDPSTEATE